MSYKGAERRRMWRFKQYMAKNGWMTEMVKIAEPKLFASHKTQQKKRTKQKKEYLFSSKEGDADNLIQTLSDKALNFSTIL